jgi:hypothetical protein
MGTILGAIVFFLLFHFWISPWLQRHMGGEELMDLMQWRTPADVDAALSAYGESGRALYRRVLLVDLLFPLVYVPPLALSTAFAAPKLRWLRRYAYIAVVLPIVGGLFDWGENLTLLVQVSQFPNHTYLVSWIAGAMTLLKFTTLIASVAIIGLGLVAYARTRRGAARQARSTT